MESALGKTRLFSSSIILIMCIFSIQISLKQVEGQQPIFTPDNKLKEQDNSSNTVYVANNNIKIINDFFQNNLYAIVALILLAIFLMWSAKIVFGRANLAKPPFDWRDRSNRYDSYGGEPW
jgi:hypothetical protein